MPRTKESGSLITATGICRSMFTLRFQSSFQTNSIALSSQTEDILNASHVNIFITTDLRCHCHYYFGHYNILHHFVSVSPSSHVAQPTCFMAFGEPDHLDFIITAHLHSPRVCSFVQSILHHLCMHHNIMLYFFVYC